MNNQDKSYGKEEVDKGLPTDTGRDPNEVHGRDRTGKDADRAGRGRETDDGAAKVEGGFKGEYTPGSSTDPRNTKTPDDDGLTGPAGDPAEGKPTA